jgi:hypothetical protein
LGICPVVKKVRDGQVKLKISSKRLTVKAYKGGRLSTVDLLIKVACFVRSK